MGKFSSETMQLTLLATFCLHVLLSFSNTTPKNILMSESLGRNMIVGLNPALQRSIAVPKLSVGAVNRASDLNVGIGGKGQNCAVASSKMELTQPSFLLQFLGSGSEGDTVLNMLNHISPTLQEYAFRTLAPCRTCITLVDKATGEATEIIEPSGTITETEVEQLLSTITENFSSENNKLGGLAIMGSMPPGCPPELYTSIIERTCGPSSKVVLDTSVAVFPSIKQCISLRSQVALKVNAEELCNLAGVASDEGSEGTGTSVEKLLEAARVIRDQVMDVDASDKLNRGDHEVCVAVTDGPHPAFLAQLSSGRYWVIKNPDSLPFSIINPIGAGDTVSSGLMHFWTGMVPPEKINIFSENSKDIEISVLNAFRWGLACGTSSCASNKNSDFDFERAVQMFHLLSVEEGLMD